MPRKTHDFVIVRDAQTDQKIQKSIIIDHVDDGIWVRLDSDNEHVFKFEYANGRFRLVHWSGDESIPTIYNM